MNRGDSMQRRRRINPRLVKIHRSYSVEDIAHLYGVHKNTVRHWVKAGLPVLDDQRPMLFAGQELATFLQVRKNKNKRTCQPGELYCVRCRAPKKPAGGMADYLPQTETRGTLKALCPDCLCLMHRGTSSTTLELICSEISVTFVQGPEQVSNTNQPTVNSDFR